MILCGACGIPASERHDLSTKCYCIIPLDLPMLLGTVCLLMLHKASWQGSVPSQNHPPCGGGSVSSH